jgi:hypothetical protein
MDIGRLKSSRTMFEIVLWIALSLLFHWLIGISWWLDCIFASSIRIGAEHYVVLSEHDRALKQLQNRVAEMVKLVKPGYRSNGDSQHAACPL